MHLGIVCVNHGTHLSCGCTSPAMEPPCTRRGPDDASEQLAALPDWVSQASTPQAMPNGAAVPAATPRVTGDRKFIVERKPLDSW